MKKNLLLLTLFLTATGLTLKSAAQSCSSTKTLIVTGSSPCSLLLTGSLYNAVFFVKDSTGAVLATGSTNSSGTGFVNYDCTKTPDSVLVVDYVNHDSCTVAVSQSTTLAVKLTNFSSTEISSGSVQLNWTAAFEVNAKDYMVQKSTDGTNFSVIGEVLAGNNSAGPVSYNFVDNGYNGGALYRLQIVDNNGTSNFSSVISEGNINGLRTTVSVYPNPFRSTIQLTGVNAFDAAHANIQLFTATGKKVAFTISGTNAITINAGMPTGIYILKVNGQTTKLIKY